MSASLTKIWVHAIWATKEGIHALRDDVRDLLIKQTRTIFEEMNCTVQDINGTQEYFHALFLLTRDKSIKEVIETVKDGSSRWLNQQSYFNPRFEWQVGYAAFSVSEAMLRQVEELFADRRNLTDSKCKMTQNC